jgi:hypothetical protein
MSRLYELSTDMIALSEMEDDEAVVNTLEGIEMEFNKKAENIILLERNIKSDIDVIDIEILRLQKRKQVMKNRTERLKEYLRENMERTGISKIDCPLFTIICAKGRDIATVENEDLLPDDCVSIKTEIKPDKSVILEKLKAGENVPGAVITKTKSSIKIK